MNLPEKSSNPFGSNAVAARSGLVSVEQQRAIAEIQAAMIVARSMPRDRKQALDYILLDCTDPDLAEEAEYEYSRGGSKISGPSIRLLETVARRWGNLSTGIEELSRHDGYSEFKAYAVDLETNWRDEKKFQVKHWRDTEKKGGAGYQVTSERDIYEVGANMGARRKRACMEAVIPSDVIRQAQDQCQLTLKTKVEVTPELLQTMLDQFAKFNVTKDMIEKRVQRHLEAITPGLVIQLRRIYNSMKDGMSGPEEWFPIEAPAAGAERAATGATALKQTLSKGTIDRETGEIRQNAGDPDVTQYIPGAGEPKAEAANNAEAAPADTHTGKPSGDGTAAAAAVDPQAKVVVDYEKLKLDLETLPQGSDELHDAASLIGNVEGFDRRNTLTNIYLKRKKK